MDLRAGRDDDRIGTALLATGVREDVGAAGDAVGQGRIRGRIEHRELLAREREQRGTGTLGERDAPSRGRLVGVRRTDDEHVRDQPESGEMLDGLVRGTVLAQSDAVVREDVDRVQVAERSETDGGSHVVAESEER